MGKSSTHHVVHISDFDALILHMDRKHTDLSRMKQKAELEEATVFEKRTNNFISVEATQTMANITESPEKEDMATSADTEYRKVCGIFSAQIDLYPVNHVL